MKIQHPQPRRDTEAHLMPLINIVFLLLIFFMLTSTLSQPEPFAIDPPASASTEAAEPQELTVLIAANGRLAVGEQEVDEAGLRQLLGAYLSRQDQVQVWLKADAQLEAARLMTVMEVIRGAGVEKLLLLTAWGDG